MKMVHHPCGAATVWPCTAGFVAVYLLFHSATVQLSLTAHLISLNYASSCIIKSSFFVLLLHKKMKNTYIYIYTLYK